MKHIGDILAIHQLWYGTPLGVIVAVSMQPGNLLPNVPTGQVLLKLDFNNPYNRVKMDNVLKSVIQNSPEIFTFMLPHSLSI